MKDESGADGDGESAVPSELFLHQSLYPILKALIGLVIESPFGR